MNKILLYLLVVLMISCYSCERFETKKAEPIQKKSYREKTVNEYGDTIYLFYTSEGRLQSRATYKYGMKNGVAYNYYKDGVVQNELWYANDFKNGPAKWYYESGSLNRETNYKNGRKEGIQKVYYENGMLKAEVPYVNDEPVVGTKEYKISGTLITDYPRIVVSPLDKLQEESTYYLRFRLKPETKKVSFYLTEDYGYGEIKSGLNQYTIDGVVTLPIALNPGESVKRKVNSMAIFITRLGNPMVLKHTYDLDIEHKKH